MGDRNSSEELELIISTNQKAGKGIPEPFSFKPGE